MALPPSLQPAARARHRRFPRLGRRASILVFSVALGVLACAATGAARSEPAFSRFFTARAVRRVGPAVVRIERVQIEPLGGRPAPPPRRPGMDAPLPDPFFEQFFNQWRQQKHLGAGVVFTREGLVLTTAQTVEPMDYHLDIHFTDGRTLPGKLVGVDFVADVAVVKVVAPPPFPVAPLGDSDALKVGARVRAIGKDPAGAENTVATGLVSHLNHTRHRSDGIDAPDEQLPLIRTDAAVDRYNAGGPLVNSAGDVIGISTLAPGESASPGGFAIPVNTARAVAEALVRTGLRHPTVGASVQSLTPALAQEFNQNRWPPWPLPPTAIQLPERHGVLVLHVRSGSPAQQAGLRIGDLVLSAGRKRIASPGELFQAVAAAGVGGRLQLGIVRHNQEQQVAVVPEAMAAQINRAMRDTVTPLPSPGLPHESLPSPGENPVDPFIR